MGNPDAHYRAISTWDPNPAYHAGTLAPALLEEERERAGTALREATERFPVAEPMLLRGRDVPSLIAAIVNLEADLMSARAAGRGRRGSSSGALRPRWRTTPRAQS